MHNNDGFSRAIELRNRTRMTSGLKGEKAVGKRKFRRRSHGVFTLALFFSCFF